MDLIVGAIGVIIGGIITIAGNIINNHYSLKKQKEQFKSEQEAKQKEWLRNEHKAESEKLRNVFQNAHLTISTFIASEFIGSEQKNVNDKVDSEKKVQLVREVLESFSLITLRYPSDSELLQKLEGFIMDPDEYRALELRDKLKEIVLREGDFFLETPDVSSVEESDDEKNRKIHFRVDDEYRKKQLIEGIEIEQSQSKKFNVSELTKSQREKLVKAYFGNALPTNITLRLPTFNETNGEIVFNQTKWEAKINPMDLDASEIISSWEDDFEEALEDAEKHKKDHNS